MQENELNFLRKEVKKMETAKDIKKTADNTEYLKNVLLSYFEGKTDKKTMIAVCSAVLQFNENEHSRAIKCITNQSTNIIPFVSENNNNMVVGGFHAISDTLGNLGKWWIGSNNTNLSQNQTNNNNSNKNSNNNNNNTPL